MIFTVTQSSLVIANSNTAEEKTAIVQTDTEDPEAILRLANSYMDGKDGMQKDFEKAFELYNIAASKGSSNAMFALAVIYSEGVDRINKDPKEGFKWFLKSAEAGSQIAQFTVGILLSQDNPKAEIPSDLKSAYIWFSLASRSDDIPRVKKAASGLADILAEELSAKELKQAEDTIKNWKAKTSPM